jgi:hypothetical protein
LAGSSTDLAATYFLHSQLNAGLSLFVIIGMAIEIFRQIQNMTHGYAGPCLNIGTATEIFRDI